ncbi:MAG: hypothetical protein ACYCX9_13215, partial [Candidatus Dormibacteria bacterium]
MTSGQISPTPPAIPRLQPTSASTPADDSEQSEIAAGLPGLQHHGVHRRQDGDGNSHQGESGQGRDVVLDPGVHPGANGGHALSLHPVLESGQVHRPGSPAATNLQLEEVEASRLASEVSNRGRLR